MRQQFSLSVHPFAVVDNAPQSSTAVEKQLKKTVVALAELAKTNHLSQADKHLKPVKNQLPDLACLMDVWWDWVEHSVVDLSPDVLKQLWLKEILLPKLYWERQLLICRSATQRPLYQAALALAQQKLAQHPCTPLCPPTNGNITPSGPKPWLPDFKEPPPLWKAVMATYLKSIGPVEDYLKSGYRFSPCYTISTCNAPMAQPPQTVSLRCLFPTYSSPFCL